MKRVILLLLCAAAVILSAQPAAAGRFVVVRYECEQLTPERDGLWS